LETAGFALAKKYLTGIIIMHLPKSLSTLKTILANTDDAKLSVEGITNQVLANEARQIHVSGECNTTAFFTKMKSNNKRNRERQKDENGSGNGNNSSTNNSSSTSGSSNDGKVCTHCKRRGHKVSNCWTLKREKKEKEKANAAATNSSKSANTTVKASITRVSKDIVHLFRATKTEGPHTRTEHTSAARTIQGQRPPQWVGSQLRCFPHNEPSL